jgi:hypothetical protein
MSLSIEGNPRPIPGREYETFERVRESVAEVDPPTRPATQVRQYDPAERAAKRENDRYT